MITREEARKAFTECFNASQEDDRRLLAKEMWFSAIIWVEPRLRSGEEIEPFKQELGL